MLLYKSNLNIKNFKVNYIIKIFYLVIKLKFIFILKN